MILYDNNPRKTAIFFIDQGSMALDENIKIK